jgi:tetratricopeptide (TPR) repeat protein
VVPGAAAPAVPATVEAPVGPPPREPSPLRSVVVLCLLALAAYGNSFRGAWVFDDFHAIVDDPLIRPGLSHVFTILFHRVAPVSFLTFMLNDAVSGLDVWSYHAFNLVVHVLAGCTLLGLLRRTLPRLLPGEEPSSLDGAALAVAALWLIHPLQTESVTYIVQRAQSLMGLFELLFFYGVARASGSVGNRGWYAVALVAFVLGMATKAHMVLAPPLALVFERALEGGSLRDAFRRNPWFHGTLLGVWLLGVAFILFGLARLGWVDIGASGRTPLGYAAAQCSVIPHYLRLCFWPDHLCLDYDWPPVRSVSEVLPGASLLAVLVAATLWAHFRARAWGLVGAWFFLNLAPSSSFIPRIDLAVEHRMYVPLASVVVAAVFAVRSLVGRAFPGRAPARRVVLSTLLGLTLLALGARTAVRNADYRSFRGMWLLTVEQQPDNARALRNLASAEEEGGDLAAALAHATHAIEVAPEDGFALAARADVLRRLERPGDALADVNAALALRPQQASFWSLRGLCESQQGSPSAALVSLGRAIELAPDRAPFWTERGKILWGMGDLDAAARDLTHAIALDPELVAAWTHRARVRLQQHDWEGAVADATRAITLAPGSSASWIDRARARRKLGRVDEAIADASRAIEIDPGSAQGHYERGSAREAARDAAGALADLDRAVTLKPQDPAFRAARADLERRLGRDDLALADYDRVLALEPKDTGALNGRGLSRLKAGRFDEAVADFTRVLALDPALTGAYLNRGQALRQKGDGAGFLADYRRFLALAPNAPVAPGARAEVEQFLAAHPELR